MKITVGVQAVIIQNDAILTIHKRDTDTLEDSYILPGGKQEFGETLEQAIYREVFEEVGVAVDVGELLFLREFIGSNHDNAQTNGSLHIISPIFRCKFKDGDGTAIPASSPNPDPDQIGVAWIPLHELANFPFYPNSLIPQLIEIANGTKPKRCYVGDVN
ncbi:NUDIX domain-containing protein [Paenibacillus lignilyticus]|uniref:NUDIX domain-containing protein n=1 Tax=Paenibacillus lignilyticus TaxID=1172615 RepID=A0ABS5CAD5_9BACL|nr:NUDIX domain-containing protein [Paenibacillus lignilyticus]MBP3962931.1 NUDIX domain-containing protein [Paenibacillus lignilyticus]